MSFFRYFITLNCSKLLKYNVDAETLTPRCIQWNVFSNYSKNSSAIKCNRVIWKKKISLNENGFLFDGVVDPNQKPHEYLKTSQNHNHRSKSDAKQEESGFDPINIHLIEAFGLIGTAVAVGIDNKSRNDYHTNRSDILNGNSNLVEKFLYGKLFYNFLEKFQVSTKSDCSDSVRYCGSCHLCQSLFKKLFCDYFSLFSSQSCFSKTLVLNIFNDGSKFTKNNKNLLENKNEEFKTEPTNLLPKKCDSYDENLQFDKFLTQSQIEELNNFISKSLKKNIDLEKEKLNEGCLKKVLDNFVQNKNIEADCSGNNAIGTNQEQKDLVLSFQNAAALYADRLNNLRAIYLINDYPDKAMKFWSNCEKNYSTAFFNMGVAYERGKYSKNVSPDFDRAHDCYALAASIGHREAIYNLALFYLYGKGKTKIDIKNGVGLMRLASSKGVKLAQEFCSKLNRQKHQITSTKHIQQLKNSCKLSPVKSNLFSTNVSLHKSSSKGYFDNYSDSTTSTFKQNKIFSLKRNKSSPSFFEMHLQQQSSTSLSNLIS